MARSTESGSEKGSGSSPAAPPDGGAGDTQKATRHDPRYNVDVRVDWSTGRMFLSDHATNISRSGVFIQSGTAMPQDAEVSMVLWLPGRRPVRVTGHVVWSRETGAVAPVGGAGLRLVEMHPADRALLHDYLDELARGMPPDLGH